MVKHINLNNEAIYKIEIKVSKKNFIPGVRYGREGGAGAHGGGGA
jgi:hypothetical protein